MGSLWQIQEAKNKLSEVIQAALRKGPQVITKHGREIAVLLSREQYNKMRKSQEDLVDFFRNSPLVGTLDLERIRDDQYREIEL